MDMSPDQQEDHPIIRLPADLYLPILDKLEDRSLLAKICLVDRLFLELAREKLYEFVWVRPWEAGADPKFRLLFRTLNENPQIAELVHKLDVRYYPLAAGIITWEEFCVSALRKMSNLESITWTRNKTFRSSMLEAIASLPKLTKLEINGNSKWSYDPTLLNNLHRLQELRIILPDRKVAENLKELVKLRAELSVDGSTGDATERGGLRVLELISQDSRWMDDLSLQELAPYLKNLRVFKLWGCSHIGPRGYFQVLRSAQDTLEELALEGVGWGDEHDLLDEDLYLERESPLTIDVHLRRLQHLSVSETAFHRLTLADKSRQEQADVMEAIQNSFSRTRTTLPNDQDGAHVSELADTGNVGVDWSTVRRHSAHPRLGDHSYLPPTLSAIHISGNKEGVGVMPGDTASHLVLAVADMWKSHLTKFWLTNCLLMVQDLVVIAERLPQLDTLMLRMSESRKDPKWIASHLARMPHLRVFHLQTSERRPDEEVYSMTDLTTLARHCGDKLEQIGWANRVYHVRRKRMIFHDQEGTPPLPLRQKGWRQCDAEWEQIEDTQERNEVYLEPWQAGTGSIPEIFQVWRA